MAEEADSAGQAIYDAVRSLAVKLCLEEVAITLEIIGEVLERRGCRPRWVSRSEIRSGCPLHASRSKRCVTVREAPEGKLLGYCHSCGASLPDIVSTLGIIEGRPQSVPKSRRTAPPGPVQEPEPMPDLDRCERDLYRLGRERFLLDVRRFEAGVLLNHRIGWCVERLAYVIPLTDVRSGHWGYARPALGVKFYDPDTGRKWTTRGTLSSSILYGQLPAGDGQRLWIVEGEPDALSVLSNGDPLTHQAAGAVTPCDGARIRYRPRPEFVTFLQTLRNPIVVCGHADPEGEAYRDGWSEALKRAGVRHEIAVWSGPGPDGGERLPKGYDLNDEARHAA